MMLWLQVLNCFKQFRILSDFHLSHSACQLGPPGPLIPVSAADRNANNGGERENCLTHEKAHILLANGLHPALAWQTCSTLSLGIDLSLVCVLLHLASPPLVIFLAHVDFFIHPIICTRSFPPLTPASFHLSFPLFPGPLASFRQA